MIREWLVESLSNIRIAVPFEYAPSKKHAFTFSVSSSLWIADTKLHDVGELLDSVNSCSNVFDASLKIVANRKFRISFV